MGKPPLRRSLKYFYSKADQAFHLLMDLGANVNIADNTGTMPLCYQQDSTVIFKIWFVMDTQ